MSQNQTIVLQILVKINYFTQQGDANSRTANKLQQKENRPQCKYRHYLLVLLPPARERNSDIQEIECISLKATLKSEKKNVPSRNLSTALFYVRFSCWTKRLQCVATLSIIASNNLNCLIIARNTVDNVMHAYLCHVIVKSNIVVVVETKFMTSGALYT